MTRSTLKNILSWTAIGIAVVGLIASIALNLNWDIALGFAGLLVIAVVEFLFSKKKKQSPNV